jgi:hypothetical protein
VPRFFGSFWPAKRKEETLLHLNEPALLSSAVKCEIPRGKPNRFWEPDGFIGMLARQITAATSTRPLDTAYTSS